MDYWKNYYVENNFAKFIERNNKKINNFRYYINNCSKIKFIILRYNSIPIEIYNIIKSTYSTMSFELITLNNISNDIINITRNKTLENAIQFEVSYLKYLNIDKYP